MDAQENIKNNVIIQFYLEAEKITVDLLKGWFFGFYVFYSDS